MVATISSSKIPRWWITALGAALITITALVVTPTIYSSILENQALEWDSQFTVGRVVSHKPQSGRNQCSSAATVEYQVHNKTYNVIVSGCGAQPAYSPPGTQATVNYVRTNPTIARASIRGAATSRAGWWWIILLWIISATLIIASRIVWKTEQVQ